MSLLTHLMPWVLVAVLMVQIWTANHLLDIYRDLIETLENLAMNLAQRLYKIEADAARKEAAAHLVHSLRRIQLKRLRAPASKPSGNAEFETISKTRI